MIKSFMTLIFGDTVFVNVTMQHEQTMQHEPIKAISISGEGNSLGQEKEEGRGGGVIYRK